MVCAITIVNDSHCIKTIVLNKTLNYKSLAIVVLDRMAPTRTHKHVAEILQTPPGMEQVADEFRVVDADTAPDLVAHARCTRCGQVFRSPIPEHVDVTGHVCTDGYRQHRDGAGIERVE